MIGKAKKKKKRKEKKKNKKKSVFLLKSNFYQTNFIILVLFKINNYRYLEFLTNIWFFL